MSKKQKGLSANTQSRRCYKQLKILNYECLAESEGFEPPDLLQSAVFKTVAIDLSANFPSAKIQLFLFLQRKNYIFLIKINLSLLNISCMVSV